MTMANKGDIVYVKRRGYRHFGIYAGNQQVIHYYKERNPLLCDGIITETTLAEFMSDSDTLYVLNGIGPTADTHLFDWIIQRVFDGEITSVAESRHAVGVAANDMELLIHVGVDTVAMNGDGFDCLVKEGDQVKAGQPLIRFSRAKIKAAGYSDTVAVLLTNSDDLDGVEYGAK